MTGFTENYKNKNKKGSEGHAADIKGTICTGELSVSAVSVRVLLDTAVLLGMQNVELWAAGPSFCLDTMDEAQMKEKAAQIRSREIQYAVSRRSNASIRSIWQQKMKKYVNIAYAILNVHFMQQKY